MVTLWAWLQQRLGVCSVVLVGHGATVFICVHNNCTAYIGGSWGLLPWSIVQLSGAGNFTTYSPYRLYQH